jgi:hypothetical protein
MRWLNGLRRIVADSWLSYVLLLVKGRELAEKVPQRLDHVLSTSRICLFL